MWSQLVSNPLSVTLSASLGILATAAINRSWGLALWNPWDLLEAILDRYWSSSTRFAVFLVAFCWMVSILGTNIAGKYFTSSPLLFCALLSLLQHPHLISFPARTFHLPNIPQYPSSNTRLQQT